MVKAPVVKRFIAYLIDGLLAGFILGIGIGVAFGVMMLGLTSDSGGLAMVGTLVYIVALIGSMVVLFAYWLLKDGLFGGRSLGKKFMGLKVVTKEGKPCNFVKSALRNITFMVPLLNFVECLMPFVDKEGLRFGDKIAGTQVVG